MNQDQYSEKLTRYQKHTLQAVINARTIDDLRDELSPRPSTLKRWLNNEYFCKELIEHIELAHKISGLLLAGSLSDAAVRLNKLIDTDKPETARKTCTDIFKLLAQHNKPKHAEKEEKPAPPQIITDAEECERLWNLYRPVEDDRDDDDAGPEPLPLGSERTNDARI